MEDSDEATERRSDEGGRKKEDRGWKIDDGGGWGKWSILVQIALPRGPGREDRQEKKLGRGLS